MVALLLISLAVLLAGVAGSVLLMVRTGETRIGILLACFTLLAARQAFALWANGDASLALDANTAGELAVLAASGVGLMVLTGLRRTLDERDRAETLHWDSMEAVRRLGELSAQTGLSLDERFETLLKIGCQCFALETGMISRVHKQRFEVIAIHAAEDFPVSRGAVFLLADTHCSATLESDRPVAFERIGDSARPGSSERAAFGFGAYLGAAIRVSGEVVGTISFGSRQPRAQRFTATDKDLLRLLAHWIGTELERRFASEEREASAAKAAAVTAAPPTRARRFESPGARTVDVNSAIERATGKLRALAGVDVDCRLADDLLPIAKPRISIGTLAESLAKVAVSAASGHGRLTLTTANLEVATSDPNVIPAVAPNRYVTFSVEITDPEIDAECLEQAFGSQADAPSLASGAITAEPLPLASIYRALQRGGGDLSLEVEAGASATLTAFLPCASADADTSTGPRLASGGAAFPPG